jgi:catechol 2,3-dioxygenase-like lactoylglutathione lyase family enzyme
MRDERIEHVSFPFGWLLIGVITIFALLSSAHAQLVSKVESVGFTVSDMDKAIDFYTHVLQFEKISDREIAGEDLENLSGVFGARVRVVDLKIGDETLELTEYLTPQGRPVPLDSRSNDHWFQHIAIIVSDMDKAYAHLRANKVRHASTGPQELPAYITAAAGIRAFYFKDFDNHVLEILSFPADKGLPKWRDLAKTGKLFLGIDHTAIVVRNTDRSLGFYRDILGLRIAGSSDNYGSEQEHLNNVKGAKLHITRLRTREDGVAVEFLEYRDPTDGRAYPSDTRSNDLWYWQTSFAARNAADLPINSIFVSNGFVDLKGNLFAFQKGAVIRDPDGHAVRLVSVARP